MGFNNEDNSYQSQEFEKSMKKMLLKTKAIKIKFYSGTGKDTNFIEMKCRYFHVLVKEIIIIPILD